MNKIIRKIIVISMVLFLLGGCRGTDGSNTDTEELKVVTTIFPLYDWTRNLTSNAKNVSVTRIVSQSTDLHNYQPSAKDIMTILDADIFIYVGGESDEWVEDVLKQSDGEKPLALNLMEILDRRVLEEETKEGMEAEEEEESEYDEHVWLSLHNAGICIDAICAGLCEKDAQQSSIYNDNAKAYRDQLDQLNRKAEEIVSASDQRTLLFADRFPFLYFCKDYGLDYYAAFKGCSAETEASFETIRFLADKCDELSLKAVITLEDSDGKIAETVVENSKGKPRILRMDSMQAGMKEEDSYAGLMEKNLEILKEAIGE